MKCQYHFVELVRDCKVKAALSFDLQTRMVFEFETCEILSTGVK